MTYYVDGYMYSASPCYAGGFSVTDEDGVLLARRFFKTEPPRKWTNMDGELWAVAYAAQLAAPEDTICSDSEVVVKWWVPRGHCKTRLDLCPLALMTHEAVEYKNLSLIWVPRAKNLAGIYNDQHRAALWSNL